MVVDVKDTQGVAPPPPYTPPQPGASSSQPPPPSNALAPSLPHNGTGSGPTPINSYYPVGHGSTSPTVAFLPYYDPRSPHSIEAARRRAINRFVGALLWALAIWVLAGFLTGGIIVDAHRSHKRHRNGGIGAERT